MGTNCVFDASIVKHQLSWIMFGFQSDTVGTHEHVGLEAKLNKMSYECSHTRFTNIIYQARVCYVHNTLAHRSLNYASLVVCLNVLCVMLLYMYIAQYVPMLGSKMDLECLDTVFAHAAPTYNRGLVGSRCVD
jgi:hypothetical protein